MPTADSIKLVECPRDAWQGLQGQVPAYIKTDYLKALISVGFKHIDAVSFVSPQAVPQMADSEEVLKDLDPPDDVEIIGKKAGDAGLDTIAYVSMAFGNPYGDLWNIDELVEAVGLLESENIHSISLADTVGVATPLEIREVVSAVLAKYGYLEIGVHLHSRPEQAGEKVLAAYDAGYRRFDSAIGGMGGCPFAQDALVGNV